MEELDIGGVGQALIGLYTTILLAHVKLCKSFRKRDEPIIFVPEQNTYQSPNENLYYEVALAALRVEGVHVHAYYQINNRKQAFIGKLVTTKDTMIMDVEKAISGGFVGRIHALSSYGKTVRDLFFDIRAQLRIKCRAVGMDVMDTTPENYILNPSTEEDFNKLHPREAAEFIYANAAGFSVNNVPMSQQIFEDGKELLCKLQEEMAAVQLIKLTNKFKVVTGGKRAVGGYYSRDDLFSAALLGINVCVTFDVDIVNEKCKLVLKG